MNYDADFMINNNYEYSKILLKWSVANRIDFIYASSASVYGTGTGGFVESGVNESALNAYGFSKLMFDNYARRFFAIAKAKVIGLRYFNVFGPLEYHKDAGVDGLSVFQQMLNDTQSRRTG